MKLLAPSTYRAMAWKNGLGETLEVARAPDGEDFESFDWRISLARIEADGAYSRFAGTERTIALVEGTGITMVFADGRAHQLLPFVPLTYDGGEAVDGRLIDGPVRALNVMTRRQRFSGRLDFIREAAELDQRDAAAVRFAIALRGTWTASFEPATGTAAAGSMAGIPPLHALRVDDPGVLELFGPPGSIAAIATVLPAA